MGKIVAIGGGEIGRPRKNGGNYPVETTAIDKEMIKLSGRSHPNLLFIPTASGDSESYFDVIKTHFGERLGCKCNVLMLTKEKLKKNEIKEKIMSADIIYVGGGNTLKMLILWRKFGVDRFLYSAYKKGIVLSGVSAGAICWFKSGISDSRQKSTNKNSGYISVKGLGILPLTLSPHFFTEKKRRHAIMQMVKKYKQIFAIDDCAALEIVDDKYKIIASKKGRTMHRFTYNNSKTTVFPISLGKFRPIEDIM